MFNGQQTRNIRAAIRIGVVQNPWEGTKKQGTCFVHRLERSNYSSLKDGGDVDRAVVQRGVFLEEEQAG
jgi:hypothetical protein